MDLYGVLEVVECCCSFPLFPPQELRSNGLDLPHHRRQLRFLSGTGDPDPFDDEGRKTFHLQDGTRTRDPDRP